MSENRFEAACHYEWVRSPADQKYPLNLMVIDSDSYAVASYTCSQSGEVTQVMLKEGSENACIHDIENALRNETGKSIFDTCFENAESVNNKMRVFYKSNKLTNAELPEMNGLAPNCAEYDRAFQTVRDRLDTLVSDPGVETEINKEDVKYIIIGRAAVLYPVMYAIKSYLTFEPSLPDERIANDSYDIRADQIVDSGEKEYQEKKRKETQIKISLCSSAEGENRLQALPVTWDKNLKPVEFLEPIFVAADEKLLFDVNGVKYEKDLPYSVSPKNSDIIGIGAYVSHDEAFIQIRKFDRPTSVYEIPLGSMEGWHGDQ